MTSLPECSATAFLSLQVLNEVVIDRGPSSYLSNVDVYLDGHLITTVQGDGKAMLQLGTQEPHMGPK